MKLRVIKTPLEGLLVVEVDFFQDDRGFFMESWHKRDFAEAGLSYEFVQDSHSRSTYPVLRGLHYQDMRAPIVKLVRCTAGRVFDVAVDLRVNSPTCGKWFGVELTAENKTQLLVPIGFAHGFLTLSEVCEIQYKQTAYYHPDAEGGVAWNDNDIAIEWPLRDTPILSTRDQNQQSLKKYLQNPAFH